MALPWAMWLIMQAHIQDMYVQNRMHLQSTLKE